MNPNWNGPSTLSQGHKREDSEQRQRQQPGTEVKKEGMREGRGGHGLGWRITGEPLTGSMPHTTGQLRAWVTHGKHRAAGFSFMACFPRVVHGGLPWPFRKPEFKPTFAFNWNILELTPKQMAAIVLSLLPISGVLIRLLWPWDPGPLLARGWLRGPGLWTGPEREGF